MGAKEPRTVFKPPKIVKATSKKSSKKNTKKAPTNRNETDDQVAGNPALVQIAENAAHAIRNQNQAI